MIADLVSSGLAQHFAWNILGLSHEDSVSGSLLTLCVLPKPMTHTFLSPEQTFFSELQNCRADSESLLT